MRRTFSRLPSPALVISMIALIFALGGTSYAAFKVGSKNIKNGAVSTKKLHNGAVTTKKLHNGAVTQSKLGSGLSVANANSANTANNAGSVNGVSIRKFSVKLPTGTGTTNLIDTGVVTITGACTAGAATISVVKDSGAPSTALNFASASTGTNNTVQTNGFLNFTGPTNITATPANTIGHFVAVTTTGSQVTANYMARNSSNFSPPEAVCVFGGTTESG